MKIEYRSVSYLRDKVMADMRQILGDNGELLKSDKLTEDTRSQITTSLEMRNLEPIFCEDIIVIVGKTTNGREGEYEESFRQY